jgi:hypothetical protein
MQSKKGNAPFVQRSFAGSPSVIEEGIDHQETSHVFYCMRCDLHFQMDMAVTSRKGSQERNEGVVQVRLAPASSWSGKERYKEQR